MADGPLNLEEYDLYLAKGIDSLCSAGKYKEGLAAFSRAIEISPQKASAWAYKALLLEAGGEDRDAFEAFRVALEIDPGHPAVLLYAAIRLVVDEDNYIDALEMVETSLEKEPSSAAAWRQKGIMTPRRFACSIKRSR